MTNMYPWQVTFTQELNVTSDTGETVNERWIWELYTGHDMSLFAYGVSPNFMRATYDAKMAMEE